MKWETFHITGIYANHTCLNFNWKKLPMHLYQLYPCNKVTRFSLVVGPSIRQCSSWCPDIPWFLYPPATKLRGRGYTGFTLSVGLSVCRTNRVCSVSSTILAGSISYLHILSRTFRWCVACYFFHFGKYFNFVTLTLSSFDLGSDMNQWYG